MFSLAVESVSVPLAVIVPTIGLIGTGFYAAIRYLVQFNSYLQADSGRKDEVIKEMRMENSERAKTATETLTRAALAMESIARLSDKLIGSK